MNFKEFDLSDYINALEDFKTGQTDDIIRYWGNTGNFDLFIQRAKDHEPQIAEQAIKQFGSVEKYTESMKYNLEHLSELMEKQSAEAIENAQRIDDLYRRLTADREKDVSSPEIQDIVREIGKIMKENITADLSLEKYFETIIDVYSKDYVRKVTDTKYGKGAADYIVGAFRCYCEK